MMIDKITGKVAYAVLSFGGFLGMGDEYLPANAGRAPISIAAATGHLTKSRPECPQGVRARAPFRKPSGCRR
jgi:hypothetical protein